MAVRHFEEHGRCVIYLNEKLPLPLEVLQNVQDVDLSSAIKHLQDYDPSSEVAFLWVPLESAERFGGPKGGTPVAGRFELHASVRE